MGEDNNLVEQSTDHNPRSTTNQPSTLNGKRETRSSKYICPMEVNDDLVNNLAQLARLEFNESEKIEIKNDLQKMIAFIEKLNELDTTGVEPLLHMSENVNVLREDDVKVTITREEALRSAPLHDELFFKVPKVIRK